MTCCVVPDWLVSIPGRIWAHRWALWELTRHPLLAVALTAYLTMRWVQPWVQRITAEYQRRGKLWEFQFQIFTEAGPAFYKTFSAAWELSVERIKLDFATQMAETPTKLSSREGSAETEREPTNPIERMERLIAKTRGDTTGNAKKVWETERDQLNAQVKRLGGAFEKERIEARALIPVMTGLFERETQAHWRVVIGYFNQIQLEDDAIKRRKALHGTNEEWYAFVLHAMRELKLPHAESAVEDKTAEDKESEDQYDALVRMVEEARRRT